jgi:hypothetical protein
VDLDGGTAMTEVSAPQETVLRLSPSETGLVRSALRFLMSTLGRDEADELAAVKELLRRLEEAEQS